MSYRPICDTWLLARSKVKYYGAYPAGSLIRMRDLLGVGISDAVLHVCSGHIRSYPYKGLGKNDLLLDLDPKTRPDFLQDAREPFPIPPGEDKYDAILCDPPYSPEDALKYDVGKKALESLTRSRKLTAEVVKLPSPRRLLLNGLDAVKVGGRVGILHYVAPRMPRDRARFVALVTVFIGFENRPRLYSVYERTK